MARFSFFASKSPLLRVFYENNWFTGSNAPPELAMFFSGDILVQDYSEERCLGVVNVDFKYKWFDVAWYTAGFLAWLFQGFVFNSLTAVFLCIGLFFSLTRLGVVWFFLFRAGLRKKGFDGVFRLTLKKGDWK